jgi:Flp pilus assembly protein TadB
MESPGTSQARAVWRRVWWGESRLVASAGWSWLTPSRLLVIEMASAGAAAMVASVLTSLPALCIPAGAGAVAVVRAVVGTRSRARRRERQDAVLEAVRMLRQVLEVGAGSVQQAIAVLAERGPLPLRHEFRVIAATTLGRRQAWCMARDRINEPLFDMLAAAVLIQGPGGGELAPLFAELESTVSGAQEVEREAEALQVQARSASAIIVCLPIAFLLILSTLRSPYLNAFHSLGGEAFLLLMLAVMAISYAWMRRILRLEGLQRVRIVDA